MKQTIPALAITPNLPVSIEGNFKEIENYLRRREKEIATLELTEQNIELVKVIKSEAVTYRRRAEEIVKTVRQKLFKDPETVLKAKVQPIFDLIASIENRTDTVLAKQEDERIAGFRAVLDMYSEQFQRQYALSDAYRARVEYKKPYFNKTAVEKEVKADLEAQFAALRKEEDAFNASVRLIEQACKDNPLLNVNHYLGLLREEDVATIQEKIAAEKERLSGLTQTGSTNTGTVSVAVPEEAPEKVVLGIPDGIDFTTDFPGRMKTIRVEIKYPCDTGDALTEMFRRLKSHGITVKALQEEAVF